MATNKNQHFVPRCYLRAFTTGGDNKTINIFNIDHARYIAGAPVRSQCSGDYFYGQDQRLEDAIRHVEGTYDAEARSLVAGCNTLNRQAAFVLRSFLGAPTPAHRGGVQAFRAHDASACRCHRRRR